MKLCKSIFPLILVLLCSTASFSQSVDVEIPSPSKPRKFSLSVTQGLSISSTGHDMIVGMENSGLNDWTPAVYHEGGWIFPPYISGGESYPKKKETNSYFNFKARYDLTSKIAVAINWNTAMKASVTGYERSGEDGNYLTLDSKVKILTVDYILRTGKGGSGLSVGPAIAFHNVYQLQQYQELNQYRHKGIKPGIHLGYTLSFIKNSNWIVAANVQYNWFPKDTIGPITIDGEFTSVYDAQPVGLSNLGLGITTGLKF